MTGRRDHLLSQIQHELETEFGVKVWAYELDVTSPNSVKKVCEAIFEDVKQVHILVNNAGLALGLDKFYESDMTDVVTMLDTNVKGLLYMTRHDSSFLASYGGGKSRSHH